MPALVVVSATTLCACSLPGLAVDDARSSSWFAIPDQVAYEPVVRPITAALIREQREDGPASSGAAAPSSPSIKAASSPRFEYRVGPGDVLSVIVWGHPELTNPLGMTEAGASESAGRLVHADGTIFFPYVGQVEVAGRTPIEIRRAITEGLKRVIQEPQVDVRVIAYRSKQAFVVGNVAAPCRVQITDRPLTIVDALNRCQTAGSPGGEQTVRPIGTRVVRLLRDGQTRTINLQQLYLRGDPTFGVRLQDGDRIYVTDDTRNRVFMVGEFNEQATIPIPTSGLSLSEAIAAAGGVNLETVDDEEIYVIRGMIDEGVDEDGQVQIDLAPVIYHLNESSAGALILADQFKMRARDVVFASAADFVSFNRALSQIAPALQLLFPAAILLDDNR